MDVRLKSKTELKTLKSYCIEKTSSVKQAMRQIGENTGRVLYIVNEDNKLLGTLSDGDIRKWILAGGDLSEFVERVGNRNPTTVDGGFSIDAVKDLMLDKKIESIPVVNLRREIVDILLWDNIFAGKNMHRKGPLDVQVVIMAGGKGTRLDPFTKILPKPLIPVNGKPIIEIIMDKFSECGVDEFYLCVNHKSRMIRSYFQDVEAPWKIYYNVEEKPLGTIGGLRLIQDQLRDPFLVTNCDIIIESDYAEIVRFHKEKENELTLVVSCRHYVIPYGVCEIQNGGDLKSIREKPEYDLLVNTGMCVISKSMLDLIPLNQSLNMNELINIAKEKKRRVGIFPINQDSWIDVGQWEEYHKAGELLRAKK